MIYIGLASRRVGIFPLRYVIFMYLASCLTVFLMVSILTEFPWHLLALLVFGWSFLSSMILAYAIGLTGYVIDVPFVNETTILVSGYQGTDIWFAPLMITSGIGGYFAATYKMCELLNTTITSYIAAHLIISAIAWILSLVYMELFWMIAPIPSTVYPATITFWPPSVVTRALWITGAFFRLELALYVGISFGIGILLDALFKLTKIPGSVMALAVGGFTATPVAFTFLLGGLTSYMLTMWLGKEIWAKYRPVVAAGMFLGESIVVVLAVSASMVMKALWPLPY